MRKTYDKFDRKNGKLAFKKYNVFFSSPADTGDFSNAIWAKVDQIDSWETRPIAAARIVRTVVDGLVLGPEKKIAK